MEIIKGIIPINKQNKDTFVKMAKAKNPNKLAKSLLQDEHPDYDGFTFVNSNLVKDAYFEYEVKATLK